MGHAIHTVGVCDIIRDVHCMRETITAYDTLLRACLRSLSHHGITCCGETRSAVTLEPF